VIGDAASGLMLDSSFWKQERKFSPGLARLAFMPLAAALTNWREAVRGREISG
jgi:hypothetical protein